MTKEQNSANKTDNADWCNLDRIPKKRKWWRSWAASLFICSISAGVILYFAFSKITITQYKENNVISATMLANIKNGSVICYTREEKKEMNLAVFFNLALGLLSIVVGIFCGRFSLIFEEIFHLKSRYKGKPFRMIRACFNGISWPAVATVVILTVITIPVVTSKSETSFENKHIMIILSGIGIGPLVMHLLNLNTQSEVQISTILEEKETYVANGLAWSYYLNYLDKALPIFNELFTDNNKPVQDEGEKVRLNLNKMILLLTHNCNVVQNLEEHDNKIRKVTDIVQGKFRFPVYELTDTDNSKHTYVIKYVMQPLQTIHSMSKYERPKAVTEKERGDQVKLLYRTLLDILNEPLVTKYEDMCIFVPIKTKKEELQNGGLTKLIIQSINCVQSIKKNQKHHSGQMDGFIQVPTVPKDSRRKSHMQEGCSSAAVKINHDSSKKINETDALLNKSEQKKDDVTCRRNKGKGKGKCTQHSNDSKVKKLATNDDEVENKERSSSSERAEDDQGTPPISNHSEENETMPSQITHFDFSSYDTDVAEVE